MPFGGGGGGEAELRRMSDETGGRVFQIDRRNTLDDAFKDIQEEMRSQYSIGYSPRIRRRTAPTASSTSGRRTRTRRSRRAKATTRWSGKTEGSSA